jgi:hypothetical protein
MNADDWKKNYDTECVANNFLKEKAKARRKIVEDFVIAAIDKYDVDVIRDDNGDVVWYDDITWIPVVDWYDTKYQKYHVKEEGFFQVGDLTDLDTHVKKMREVIEKMADKGETIEFLMMGIGYKYDYSVLQSLVDGEIKMKCDDGWVKSLGKDKTGYTQYELEKIFEKLPSLKPNVTQEQIINFLDKAGMVYYISHFVKTKYEIIIYPNHLKQMRNHLNTDKMIESEYRSWRDICG